MSDHAEALRKILARKRHRCETCKQTEVCEALPSVLEAMEATGATWPDVVELLAENYGYTLKEKALKRHVMECMGA